MYLLNYICYVKCLWNCMEIKSWIEIELKTSKSQLIVVCISKFGLHADALKANVIEYEERYETCKRENQETLQQLEKLTSDFERLRKGIAETKAKAETSDASITVGALRICSSNCYFLKQKHNWYACCLPRLKLKSYEMPWKYRKKIEINWERM